MRFDSSGPKKVSFSIYIISIGTREVRPNAPMASTNLSGAQSAPEFMIPKAVYFSAEVAELEKTQLWPKVWQVVCCQEDLTSVGSYVTYEILDESIIVVRTAEGRLQGLTLLVLPFVIGAWAVAACHWTRDIGLPDDQRAREGRDL